MSVLTLVRHGQASYMAEDYDRLSPLGEDQSRKLAEFWVNHRIEFDFCYCGPAKRHRKTAEIVEQIVRQSGLRWPEKKIIPELDEFDAFRMMQLLSPTLIEIDPTIRKLNDNFQENRHLPEAGYLLQKFFEAVARRWCSGEHDMDGLETWAQFRERVSGSIATIRGETGRGKNIVAITSGGPISAAVASTMDLPPLTAIELLWLSRNTSFTELLFDNERLSLHSFNAVPHLDHRDLLTYR